MKPVSDFINETAWTRGAFEDLEGADRTTGSYDGSVGHRRRRNRRDIRQRHHGRIAVVNIDEGATGEHRARATPSTTDLVGG